LVGVAAQDIRALEFGDDSSWQNYAEFTAGVCTVRGFKVLLDRGLTVDGERPTEIELQGDSMSALSWVRKSRFCSCLVANAARVYVLQSVVTGLSVICTVHLLAALNKLADALSRMHAEGISLEDLKAVYEELEGITEVLDIEVDDILPLCNPNFDHLDEDAFADHWLKVLAAVQL
jgi:hypothetical protein